MIDNIEHIKPLLNFEKEGEFYYLLILKRKKDQPEGERDNHQSVRTIRSYCIKSVEQLEKKYEEIKILCEVFKARCYIHVQKQSHLDVSLNMMMELSQRIKNGNHEQQSLFDSVVGSLKTNEKRWIVDIDTHDYHAVSELAQFITYLRPEGSKVLSVIPTKNGYHLITNKFDVKTFKETYPNIDIQKKNPTLLYFPDSLDI